MTSTRPFADKSTDEQDTPLLVLLIAYSSLVETRSIIRKFQGFVSQLPDGAGVQLVIWDNKAWELKDVTGLAYHSSPQGNIGFGAAVNRVVELYSFKRILLLNSDIDIDYELFSELIRRNVALDETVIWSPSLLNPDGSLQTSPDSLFMRTPIQEVLDLFGYPARSQRRAHALYYLRGAVFSISRRLLKSVDGFDESFFLYGEEADLCFRLDGRCRLLMDPQVQVVHHGSQGHNSKSAAALRHSMHARVLLHRRYNGWSASVVVAAAVVLAKGALALKRAVSTVSALNREVAGR